MSCLLGEGFYVALAVGAVACGSDHAPTAPTITDFGQAVPHGDRVDVSGRIIDFSSAVAVSGAAIVFARLFQDPSDGYRSTADASGIYRLTVASGDYLVYVDGVRAAGFRVHTTPFRGDVLVRPGNCVAFYGIVTEARTRRPLGGVEVSLLRSVATSDASGWYRLDLGCGHQFGGTVFMTFRRDGYRDYVIGGRSEGFQAAMRFDAAMQPN
jgi:hypothetical protein